MNILTWTEGTLELHWGSVIVYLLICNLVLIWRSS